MRVVVLADTHLKDGTERLAPAVQEALEGADAVLHAGDVVSARALAELAERAPVHAVLGNNDRELVGVLPERRVVDLAGVRVGMIHDGGARVGRPGRLHRLFPDAGLVVFGHSHAPVDEEGIAGQLLFNPGSPTQRRMQPRPTFGLLDLRDGRVTRRAIVAV